MEARVVVMAVEMVVEEWAVVTEAGMEVEALEGAMVEVATEVEAKGVARAVATGVVATEVVAMEPDL